MTIVRDYVSSGKRTLVIQCDECGIEFIFCGKKKRLERRYHFCSRQCSNASQKHGVLLQQVIETNRARYGCDYPTQNQRVSEKRRQTNIERYGSSSTFSLAHEAFRKKYGVDNPSQLCDHSEKVKRASLEHYGVEHPFSAEKIKEKIRKTNRERYGVEWAGAIVGTIKPVDWQSACKKRHATMKSRNQYTNTSRSEEQFYEFLCQEFGCSDVERSANVLEWNIDFYVKSTGTYVQFDGVYWHGLDRPISVVESSPKLRDKTILSTVKRDKRQNETFAERGIRLVRVTDKEFGAAQKCNALDRIVNKIKGV